MMKSSKKQLSIILATVFFGFLGLSMPYLIFPALFLNPAFSILPQDTSITTRGLFLGITLASYPFGQFIGAPILGALSDEWGRRRILSAALFFTAIFSLLTAFALDWKMLWLLIGTRFGAGLMEGNLSIAQAMAADLKDLNKHDTFGKINAATSISYIVGPLLGGLLSTFSISLPFFVIGALCVSLSIVTRFAIKDARPHTQPRSILKQLNFVKRLRRLFKSRHLKLLLITVSMHSLAVDIFYEFGPVFLTVKWLLGPKELAFYNVVLSIALTIGCGWLAKAFAMRYPARKILSGAISLLTLSLIALTVANLPILVLALFALIGFAIAIASTNLTVQVSDAADDTIQGEVMGVQTSLRVFGDAIICLVGGMLLSVSPAIILLFAAFIATAALVYYLCFSRRTLEQANN